MKYSFELNELQWGGYKISIPRLKQYLIDEYPTLVWNHRVSWRSAKLTIDWDGVISVANEFGIIKNYIAHERNEID